MIRRITMDIECCDQCIYNKGRGAMSPQWCDLTGKQLMDQFGDLQVPIEQLSYGFPPFCPLEVLTP